jgi:hypothetical protein
MRASHWPAPVIRGRTGTFAGGLQMGAGDAELPSVIPVLAGICERDMPVGMSAERRVPWVVTF